MAKRLFKFIFIMALAAATVAAVKFSNDASPLFFYADSLEVYTLNGSFRQGVDAVREEYPFIRNKTGESCTIAKHCSDTPSEIAGKLSGEILFAERTEAGVSYYGFSDKIRYKVTLGGKAVNFQIFEGVTEVKIGLPVIFGGY